MKNYITLVILFQGDSGPDIDESPALAFPVAHVVGGIGEDVQRLLVLGREVGGVLFYQCLVPLCVIDPLLHEGLQTHHVLETQIQRLKPSTERRK